MKQLSSHQHLINIHKRTRVWWTHRQDYVITDRCVKETRHHLWSASNPSVTPPGHKPDIFINTDGDFCSTHLQHRKHTPPSTTTTRASYTHGRAHSRGDDDDDEGWRWRLRCFDHVCLWGETTGKSTWRTWWALRAPAACSCTDKTSARVRPRARGCLGGLELTSQI